MSNTTLNWEARNGAMAAMRDEGRLAVWLCYVLHTNKRNRSWPSIDTIVKETGWSRHAVCNAKAWLQEHGALEKVAYDKRVDEECKLHPRQDIMQVTGVLVIDGTTHHTLYFNSALNAPMAEETNSAPSRSIPSAPEGINSSKDINTEDIHTGVKQTENNTWIFADYLAMFNEPVSPGEHDDLAEIAKVYASRDDIREAMQLTKSANARQRKTRKVAYMRGILQDWAKNGKPEIKTRPEDKPSTPIKPKTVYR